MNGNSALIARKPMGKKRRPFRSPSQTGNSLEWFMENWHETCEVCRQDILVDIFRRGSPRWLKAIYGHCSNKSCRNQMMLICYYV